MRITAAGLKESHPHDIQMTVEAPNYSGALTGAGGCPRAPRPAAASRPGHPGRGYW